MKRTSQGAIKYIPGKLYQLMWDDYAYTISSINSEDKKSFSFGFIHACLNSGNPFIFLGQYKLENHNTYHMLFYNTKTKHTMLFQQNSYVNLFEEIT